jgi:hypothetical protein
MGGLCQISCQTAELDIALPLIGRMLAKTPYAAGKTPVGLSGFRRTNQAGYMLLAPIATERRWASQMALRFFARSSTDARAAAAPPGN